MKPDTIVYGGFAGIIGTSAKEIIDFNTISLNLASINSTFVIKNRKVESS
jgi:hypothetical protein